VLQVNASGQTGVFAGCFKRYIFKKVAKNAPACTILLFSEAKSGTEKPANRFQSGRAEVIH